MSNPENTFAAPVPAPEVAPQSDSEVSQEQAPEPAIEEQLADVDSLSGDTEREITSLEVSVSSSQESLREARARLGLAPLDEAPTDPTSQSRLEELRLKQKELHDQKSELLTKQEKEGLIKEEKGKILQEKIDQAFQEFSALAPEILGSLTKTGRLPNGEGYQSKGLGGLDSNSTQSLAQAFQEGVRMLPELLRRAPELLNELDSRMTQEATERVEAKLAREKEDLQDSEPAPEEPSAGSAESAVETEGDDGPSSTAAPAPSRSQVA